MGSQFVTELANLYDGYGSASGLESITLKATMVLPPLLLQKPLSQSKSREHIKCLERRLLLWCEGDINALLNEGLMIQQHLEHSAISPSLTTLVSLLVWFLMAKLRPLCGFLWNNLKVHSCLFLYQIGSLLSLMNSLRNILIALQLHPWVLLLPVLPPFRVVILLF